MRKILLVLPLLLLFAAIRPVVANDAGPTFVPGAHLRFEHITIDDGLSQNAGLALLQDRQGYLWIGTGDGLNRYDGYNLVQYKNDPDNPSSLSHNGILALHQDREGFLWIGTWGGGLNRLDPTSGKATRYPSDPARPTSLSHPIVADVFRDEQGTVWVGTLGGLDRLDPQSGAATHYRHDARDPTSLSSDAVSVIAPDGKGKLWIGTGAFNTVGAGLNLFDPATGTARRFERSGECLASPNIADILPLSDGSLWIAFGGYGVSGGGIDHFNPTTGACSHFDNTTIFGKQLTDNNITDLSFDRDGALWAASWSGASGAYLRMASSSTSATTPLTPTASPTTAPSACYPIVPG